MSSELHTAEDHTRHDLVSDCLLEWDKPEQYEQYWQTTEEGDTILIVDTNFLGRLQLTITLFHTEKLVYIKSLETGKILHQVTGKPPLELDQAKKQAMVMYNSTVISYARPRSR